MNGRMYDPVIGRVLSPDNYVQDPTNTQSYNRYSYCLNNPLRYTDPSGWFAAAADQYWNLGTEFTGFTDFSGSRSSMGSGGGGGGGWGGIGGVVPGVGYFYDANTGEYTNGYGDHVTFDEVNKKYIVPNSDKYLIYQTAVLNAQGVFVGNGNWGIIKEGIMHSDGTYQTFDSYTTASNFIGGFKSNLGNNFSGGGGDYLQYEAKFTNSYRTKGDLVWYNSSGVIVAKYPAVSGASNKKAYTITEGTWNASYLNTNWNSKYSRNDVSFRITLGPDMYDPLRGRKTSLIRIHPARSMGTEGCIGLIGDRANLLDFYNRYSNYYDTYGSISVYVTYSK